MGRYLLLVRDKKRELYAGAALVADELDYNAEAAALYHGGNRDIHSVMAELATDAWKQHNATLHAFSRSDPELWKTLTETYSNLTEVGLAGGLVPLLAHVRW